MITQKDNSLRDKLQVENIEVEDSREDIPEEGEDVRSWDISGETQKSNDNPDQLFSRLTLSMIRLERQKRRGRSARKFFLFFLLVAALCGAGAYFFGDPRTFDWVGLWEKAPWALKPSS